MKRIGIIGGSGLYNIEGLLIKDEVSVETPFGNPSDKFILATLDDREVVFLPRHGKHHQINPSDINYRANIYAMKKLEVKAIISLSACGSLKKSLRPLDFVIPTQFVDRTNQARQHTFFNEGIVVHISFAYPVCRELVQILFTACRSCRVRVHRGGIYLNMEGPQFSTLAESNLYRSWGMDIIGMTNMAEARLAREAEICYVSLAAVTDYDCWHPRHDSVTVEVIIENLRKNVEKSKMILKKFIKLLPQQWHCNCQDALRSAIVTQPEFIPEATKQKLDIIIGKYMK